MEQLFSVKRRLRVASKKNDALESTISALKKEGSGLRQAVKEGTAKQGEVSRNETVGLLTNLALTQISVVAPPPRALGLVGNDTAERIPPGKIGKQDTTNCLPSVCLSET